MIHHNNYYDDDDGQVLTVAYYQLPCYVLHDPVLFIVYCLTLSKHFHFLFIEP